MTDFNESSNVALILVEQAGVEFYTVAATGESGISISGLAILCGVSKQAISKLVVGVSTNKPVKRLERFVGESLDVSTNRRLGGGIRALRAEVCVEIIKHYAYSGNETAQFTLDKFAIIGFNSWLQTVTGWQNLVASHPKPQYSLFESPKQRSDLRQIPVTLPVSYRLQTDEKHSCKLARRVPQWQLILDFLNQHPGARFQAQELAQLLNVPYDSVRRVLSVLCRQGLIDQEFNPEYIHHNKGVPKHLYLVENVS